MKKDVELVEKQSGLKARWYGRVEGDAINVYNYDCYNTNELFENVMFTLHGAFSIYSVFGSVFLVKVSGEVI